MGTTDPSRVGEPDLLAMARAGDAAAFDRLVLRFGLQPELPKIAGKSAAMR